MVDIDIETLGAAIYRMRACCGDTEFYRRVVAATLSMVESGPMPREEYERLIYIAAHGKLDVNYPEGIDSPGGGY